MRRGRVESNHTWRGRPLPAQNHTQVETKKIERRERTGGNDREREGGEGERGDIHSCALTLTLTLTKRTKCTDRADLRSHPIKRIRKERSERERYCTVRALPRWSPTRVLDTPMVA